MNSQVSSSQSQPLRSFRLVASAALVPHVRELLQAEGFRFEPEPFSGHCFRLVEEPFPLGSSLAAFFGYVYIQDRSSMLPPLALAPAEGATVLDMCASPGSKTGFAAQLVGPDGFVLANEVNHSRLATLRMNLRCLNAVQAGTCSYPGENLPLKPGSCSWILLDPPCSGWGTVEKNPEVLRMWREDKVAPLIALQRKLLAHAATLLAPDGVLAYSTCTTNSEENERQVEYAENELGLVREELAPFPGFVWDDRAGSEGTLRVHGEKSGAQGFYIARLRKKPGAAADAAREAGQPAADPLDPEDRQPGTRAGRQARASARSAGRTAAGFAGCDVPLSSLAGATLDPSLVPAGRCAVFSGTVRFLPQAVQDFLPEGFVWQAAPLGKMQGSGFQADSRLRVFMERPDPAASLCLEDIRDVRALLSGISTKTALSGKEAGLWWRDLPLGRVSLRQGRVIASFAH